MPSFEEIQKARILNSFNTDEGLSELTKSEILDIEKGGKRAMIGEKRTFAGREYIKTASGWKFHGKGTGSKAQEHVAGALEHHVGDNKSSIMREFEKEMSLAASDEHDVESAYEEVMDKFKEKYPELTRDFQDRFDNGGEFSTDSSERKTPKSTKHKDATDHFVEEDGKHYIDTLDPDTGEKKFKPGDKVHYIDDNGKKHKGTLSDREHEDGDMFEVDREGSNPDSSIEAEELDPKEITNKQYSSESEKNMGEESIKKLKKLQGKK